MLASPGGDLDHLCGNEDWWGSVKMDGHRLIVVVDHGKVQFLSRTGKPLPVSTEVAGSFETPKATGRKWVFDGEYMPREGRYYLFDLPILEGLVAPQDAYHFRHNALVVAVNGMREAALDVIPTWTTTEDKREAADLIRHRGGEGLVFKRSDAPYRFGRRSRAWMKVKFVKEVDCVIVDQNRDGKTNWVLAVNDGAQWHEVGEVSGLAGDADKIQIGSVVTVTCLYASEDNRLVQPVTPRLRHDKPALECTLDQLLSIRANRDVESLLG
jgi:ATP-dependent DNA ligase